MLSVVLLKGVAPNYDLSKASLAHTFIVGLVGSFEFKSSFFPKSEVKIKQNLKKDEVLRKCCE
jgi:hypothetical protein